MNRLLLLAMGLLFPFFLSAQYPNQNQARLEIKVMKENRKPVKREKVNVTSLKTGKSWEAKADKNGLALFLVPINAKYSVTIPGRRQPDTLTVSAKPYQVYVHRLIDRRGEAGESEPTLATSHLPAPRNGWSTVVLHLEDLKSQPIVNDTVFIVDENGQEHISVTGPDGRAVLQIPNGHNYKVHVKYNEPAPLEIPRANGSYTVQGHYKFMPGVVMTEKMKKSSREQMARSRHWGRPNTTITRKSVNPELWKRYNRQSSSKTPVYKAETIEAFEEMAKKTGGEAYLARGDEDVINLLVDILSVHAKEKADIVIVVDRSLSMTDNLEALQEGVNILIDYLEGVPNVRVGIAMYEGSDETDPDWFHKWELTEDLPSLKSHVGEITLRGGFEPLYDALVASIEQFDWRSNSKRMILILGDEPPQPHHHDLDDAIQACIKNKVRANLYPVVLNVE